MEKLSKQQVKTILLNAPEGSDNNLIINGLVSKGYILEGYNDKPKPDGFVKSVAKDAVNTLVVKPGQRATEAATRIFAPNSMAAKGYESMADSGESQKFNVPGLGEIDAEQQKGFGDGGGRQIAGETLKIGSYLFPYGKVAGAVGNVTSKVAGNVASGVAGGYMADVGYNLADENKSLGESFIPGVGTAIGAAIPLLGPAAKALKGKGRNASDTVKRVIQGETKDIPLAEQAFKNINTKGVKTRQELSTRLADAMENQMKIVDDELLKDPRALSLDDYAIRAKNSAGQEVKTDVISNALAHLEDFFTKAGDNVSASNVNLIKQKAISGGLTHQEVNNIARMYSEEFGSKAFNKIGDPLTSVNAQMYQNTRNGLKQAARGGLGYGAEAQAADRLYSAMSNTKRLIDKGVEGVNKLEGRLKNRNLFEKLSYGATKVLNTITGGSLKAGVEALGVSNVGNKIDNWVGLEQSLSKDLKFIEKANGIESESALIKFIENYAKKFKFPGDSAVDSVKNRLKSGYSENLANQRMKSTIKNTTPKNSNIDKSAQKKSIIPSNAPTNKTSIRIIPESITPKDNVVNRMIKRFKDTPNKQGGFIKNPLADVSKRIHKDDIQAMENFIDYARNKKKLSDSQFIEAEKLAERFGISMDKGLNGVANQFELVLTGQKKVPATILKDFKQNTVTGKMEGSIGKNIDPLVSEAKKYKSAEEFTRLNSIRKILKENGLYQKESGGLNKIGQSRSFGDFSVKDEVTTTYSRFGKGYKVKQKSTPTGNIEIQFENKQVSDKIKKLFGEPQKQVSSSLIYSKSQLTDIWNKANKK